MLCVSYRGLGATIALFVCLPGGSAAWALDDRPVQHGHLRQSIFRVALMEYPLPPSPIMCTGVFSQA